MDPSAIPVTTYNTIDPTAIPTGNYDILSDPLVYRSVGALLLVILLYIGYRNYTEAYKTVWRWIVDIYDFLHHTLIFIVAVSAGISAAACWTIIAQPEITEKITNTFPAFYDFYVRNGLTVLAVFLSIFTFEWFIKWISHHFKIHGRNKVKAKNVSSADSAYLGYRIEEVEALRQKDMKKLEDAHANLVTMISGYEKALHRTGQRFEENPVPPPGIPEQRKEVRVNPATPPTEEEVTKILPLQIIAEGIIQPEIIEPKEAEVPVEVETEPEVIPEHIITNPPVQYGKVDTFVREKIFRKKS